MQAGHITLLHITAAVKPLHSVGQDPWAGPLGIAQDLVISTV